MNIFVLLFFLYLPLKGLFYLLISYNPNSSKLKKFSITTIEDKKKYIKYNKFAFSVFFNIGLIFSFFIIVLLFTYPNFVNKYYLMMMLLSLIINIFLKELTIVKIKMTELDEKF